MPNRIFGLIYVFWQQISRLSMSKFRELSPGAPVPLVPRLLEVCDVGYLI